MYSKFHSPQDCMNTFLISPKFSRTHLSFDPHAVQTHITNKHTGVWPLRVLPPPNPPSHLHLPLLCLHTFALPLTDHFSFTDCSKFLNAQCKCYLFIKRSAVKLMYFEPRFLVNIYLYIKKLATSTTTSVNQRETRSGCKVGIVTLILHVFNSLLVYLLVEQYFF